MVTDSDYPTAEKLLNHKKRNGQFYTRHKDLTLAISKLGYHVQQKRFKKFREIDGVAVVSVNKRKDGHWHWVVFNQNRGTPYIYDPMPRKKGKIRDFRGLIGCGNYLLISKQG